MEIIAKKLNQQVQQMKLNLLWTDIEKQTQNSQKNKTILKW